MRFAAPCATFDKSKLHWIILLISELYVYSANFCPNLQKEVITHLPKIEKDIDLFIKLSNENSDRYLSSAYNKSEYFSPQSREKYSLFYMFGTIEYLSFAISVTSLLYFARIEPPVRCHALSVTFGDSSPKGTSQVTQPAIQYTKIMPGDIVCI
jgi:hypothetical protein